MSHINFTKFVEKYKTDAFSIDLKNEFPQVHNILQKQIDKLAYAEFESELDEVREFAEKAVKQVKSEILNSILNNSYKIKYSNGIPHFLIPIRLYFEYKKLLETQADKPQKKYIDKKTGEPFQWLPIGVLFAQGLIYKKAYTFYYNGESFETESNLIKRVSEVLKIKENSVRPYVIDNLSETKGEKTFYNKNRMEKIISFCKDNDIKISKEFSEAYDNIIS